jgi:hypothetical protein
MFSKQQQRSELEKAQINKMVQRHLQNEFNANWIRQVAKQPDLTVEEIQQKVSGALIASKTAPREIHESELSHLACEIMLRDAVRIEISGNTTEYWKQSPKWLRWLFKTYLTGSERGTGMVKMKSTVKVPTGTEDETL